jgi:hypothetical protein
VLPTFASRHITHRIARVRIQIEAGGRSSVKLPAGLLPPRKNVTKHLLNWHVVTMVTAGDNAAVKLSGKDEKQCKNITCQGTGSEMGDTCSMHTNFQYKS